jgi:IS1 family transposase
MTGVHRDTIMRLGVRVGQACERMHDRTMHSLRVNRIEADEVWSYVGKKRARVTPQDGADVGDQYLFTALASSAKALISYKLGKRDIFTARAFLGDLRERVLGAPEISTDSLPAYERCITEIFGERCTYGQIIKVYAGEPGKDAARRYSPGHVVDVTRRRYHR